MAAHESAVCVADFTAKEDGEITIAKGDKVLIRAYNNTAGTAQGEVNGQVGWFPTNCVEVEQQVNAFDFLAKGGATPRKRSIVTDTNSLFDKKEQTKESLSTFLQTQPPKQQLLDKNILLNSYDADEFKAAQAQLVKEKESKRSKLEKFFAEKVEGKQKAKKAVVMLDEKKTDEIVLKLIEIPLGSHKHRVKHHDNCIPGSFLLAWLQENKFAKDKDDAAKVAQTLLHRNVVFDVIERTNASFSSKELYAPSVKTVEYGVMNVDKVWGEEDPGDTLTLSIDLLTDLIKLINTHKLDFRKVRGSKEFVQLSLRLCALQKCKLESLTYGSKESFWLNIHSLMVLYVHCRLSPPQTAADRQLLHDKCYFAIAKSHYTISEVRNKVILGLSPFPAKDKRATVVLGESDPKRKAALLMGIADGTSDAAAFYVFNPGNLEKKLSDSFRLLVNGDDGVQIDEGQLKVTCPRLIQRFGKDFGLKTGDIVGLLADKLLPSQAKILRDQPGFELAYRDYTKTACYAFDHEAIEG